MSDYGTRLAASANSGGELGTQDTQFQQENGNYYVQAAGNKKVNRIQYRPSPIAVPVGMILDEVEGMFLRKHEDYGPSNIAASPFGVLPGLLTRMHDKQSRAVHLVSSGHGANYEPLEDTFKDMIGYCIAAVLYLRGEWPGAKP